MRLRSPCDGVCLQFEAALQIVESPEVIGGLALMDPGIFWGSPGLAVFYKTCECYAALEKLRFSSKSDTPPVTSGVQVFAFRRCEASLTAMAKASASRVCH